ncbi:MAG TPA: hypothetical protein VK158_03760 [Acidobacteriota bacterium]|nr:hypothetical protein [Acidobacteriota bacterium]
MKTPEELLAQLMQIKEKHNLPHLPPLATLNKLGYTLLAGRIQGSCGIVALRTLAGEALLRENGKYDDPLFAKETALKIQKEAGAAYITRAVLVNAGYASLALAIARKHGGYVTFRKFMQNDVAPSDFERSKQQRPAGYWNDWSNLERELKDACQKIGHFPSPTEMIALNLPKTLSQAIANHGGVYEVSRKIGYPADRRPDGYWLNVENAKKEALQIMRTHNFKRLPSTHTLFKLGYSGLMGAIQEHYGGVGAFRKLLGDTAENYLLWQDKQKAADYARSLLKKHNWKTLPASQTLEKLGYAGFVAGVRRYHDGLESFRNYIGVQNLQTQRGLWQDRTYVIQKLHEAMAKLGTSEFPTASTLYKSGYTPLVAAINRYHGGFPTFRESLPDTEREHLAAVLATYVGDK